GHSNQPVAPTFAVDAGAPPGEGAGSYPPIAEEPGAPGFTVPYVITSGQFNNTRLSEITSLEYTTYSSVAGYAPSLSLDVR
ncbi:MAG TPA: hypothetical protein PLV68_06325, partial [Ilumatobacteraceae bacterium]|nr:hypothetical protein [Ilumatobacteraceae bacterium]